MGPVQALVGALSGAVLTAPEDFEPYRTDRSGWTAPGLPLAVVLAGAAADVQTTVRIAAAHRTPVVPRGSGTGLAGGAAGTAGSIVLDLSRMRRVLEVDVPNEVAVVEPGVITDDLAAVLASHDLWWPPDPASRAISSVGGNIATNAGGLLCAKYGVTRESVLGLAVVLADGSLVRVGRRTVKGVTGLDLTGLLVGSEGTLGVIVEATLKLRRIDPHPPVTIAATFSSVVEAAAAAAGITAAGLRPAALELMDGASCAAVGALLGPDAGLPDLTGRGAFLLVRTDGPAAAGEAALAARVIAEHRGTAELSRDAAHGERLMQVRRSAHPAFARLGEVLIEDVCVPRSALPAMFAAIERISAATGIPIPTIAHAGDGNLHPNLVVPPGLAAPPGELPDVVWQAADRLFRAAAGLGGTLTGEHGVGVLKRRWLADELGDDVMALNGRIKAAFDPLGILNPGKAV